MYNVYVETYGCSANQNNSELMTGILARRGLNIVSNEKLADIIIVNTCIVKGPTINKIFARIKELAKGDKKLIIAGCMASIPEQVKKIKKIAKASFLGSHNIKDIARAVKDIMEGKNIQLTDIKDEIKLCIPKIRKGKIIGITQILEGCPGECSYCITRFAKGRLFSYPEQEILKNIQADLDAGCKEIWLTSQDNSAYGVDGKKTNLAELLRNILKIKRKFMIRLGMMNPNHVIPILDELIECYKDKRVYKFLHIPLQSGSDSVLKDMNRKYKAKDFLKIVEEFRKNFPEMSLATDIICGYPTETAEDFEKSLEIARKIQPDIVNISRYWPMKGTKASKLEQLNQKEIIKRTSELMNLFDNLAFEKNKKIVNKEYECLVDKKGFDNTWLCRNENYKLIAIKSSKKLLGEKIKVKITKAMPHYILGEYLLDIKK
jgi:MiaB-like tRNA modifying enzyme